MDAGRDSARALLTELVVFGIKQARARLFPGIFISILLLSSHVPLFGLARYDFIFLGAVLAQVVLIVLKIESRGEVLTLCAFHFLGIVLEVFKTNPAIGSWSYSEEGFSRSSASRSTAASCTPRWQATCARRGVFST